MYVGASPDARLVSPWFGGNTPNSTGKLKLLGEKITCIFHWVIVDVDIISIPILILCLLLIKTKIVLGSSASPWDQISPSPVPVRASGSSVRSSSTSYLSKTHHLKFSSRSSPLAEVLHCGFYE